MNPPFGEPIRKPEASISNSSKDEIVTEVEIIGQAQTRPPLNPTPSALDTSPAGSGMSQVPPRPNSSRNGSEASDQSNFAGATRDQVASKRQSIFERMLSPQSLQIMMSAGGAILAIGFAIWLWSMGAFDNPIIAALAMGATNLVLLGLGVFMVTRTRYTLAGRGLSFLSALLLPLHLWFYSAQELIVVSQGGHLWIPALLICGLYALVARLTRDAAFVYQLVGGIVLTGLLFLAGPHAAFLSMWPVISTCLFLVVLGTIAIHVDRFFVEPEGAFSRKEFGKAFFYAGHLTIIGGLGYLLVGQIAESLFGSIWSFGNHAIGRNPEVNFWSLPILATAGWAYAFSHISRGRDGRFLIAASIIALWSVLTVLNVFSIALTPNLLLLVLAIGLLTTQIGIKVAAKNVENEGRISFQSSDGEIGISFVNCLLAAMSYGQAVFCLLSNQQTYTSVFLAQGLVTALSLAVRTELVLGEKNGFMSNLRLALAGALLSVFGVLGLENILNASPLTAIGIMTGLAALSSIVGLVFNFGRGQQMTAAMTTGGAVGILIAFGAALITGGVLFGTVPALAVLLVTGTCLLQVGLVTQRSEVLVASCLVFAVSLAQVAAILNITSAYAIIVAISSIGMILLLASKGLQQFRKEAISHFSRDTFTLGTEIGNLVIAAGSVAAMLFVIPKLMLFRNDGSDCCLLLFQLLPLSMAYAVNRSQAWRNTFASLGITTAVLIATTFAMASGIPLVHRIELLILAIGIATLFAGHIGWFREQQALEGTSSDNSKAAMGGRLDSVSANLSLGAILIAMPMILGILGFRFFDFESSAFWRWFHEVGGLTAGLLMLGSGILCKIRSTTIAGFATLSAFVASLVVLIRLPDALQSVSVTMMIGGGLFFAVGILLSIYRDWVLGLPAKIKDGEGVFKVLKWR